MKLFAIVALGALVACRPGAEQRTDSTTVQAVDTLKAAPPGDTLASVTSTDTTAGDTVATKTRAPTKTSTKSKILGRDSAFPPPKNLPQLDTIRRRPPQ
jgi:hypothetical protein